MNSSVKYLGKHLVKVFHLLNWLGILDVVDYCPELSVAESSWAIHLTKCLAEAMLTRLPTARGCCVNCYLDTNPMRTVGRRLGQGRMGQTKNRFINRGDTKRDNMVGRM